MAIKTRIIAGRIVQITSIICPSNSNRWVNLLKIILIKICPTNVVIITKIINVWSWKNESCSINGDALSWRDKFFHEGISKKSLSFIFGA